MSLQSLVLNPRVMRMSMFFGRHTPVPVGRRLAWWAAGIICRFEPAVYGIVRANLSQVLGVDGQDPTLAATVRQVFYNFIRGYFDLYRALRLSWEELLATVDMPEEARAVAQSLFHREQGTVLVFPHLGNFDLAGQAAAPLLPEMQVLALADPPPGFQLANELRARSGAQVTPISPAALRQAFRLLRRGGVVATGVDRPVSGLGELVPFFGRPARLPLGHIRLALKTGANVAVAYTIFSTDRDRYSMHIEPPMELIRTGKLEQDIKLNARRVLETLEEIIRRWPEQWMMFMPVWPELLEV
jgi:KDO2-lipid IV(A) lauroyltransferase